MKRRSTNLLSFKNPITKNNLSLKINNKFKKSSTAQYNYINKKTQYNYSNTVNSINNNIFLNLFNKFNHTPSLGKNSFGPKQITSNRINNSHISKERKDFKIFEVPSSSSINRKKNYYERPSLINSMNFIGNHGHINIKLNLKNQFINNSNAYYNNITDVNYCYDIIERMKEKDLKIIQLQNDLLKSQEIINNLQLKSNLNLDINKHNYLNNSLQEKNLHILTKSSESVDKIIKTAFNSYTSNITSNNRKSTRKTYKNNFLKKCGNKINELIKKSKTKEKNRRHSVRNKSRTNRNIYTGYYKNKQNDYLRFFFPLSSCNNQKPKLNSHSNDKRHNKNKNKLKNENIEKNEKNNIYNNRVEDGDGNKKNYQFLELTKKCEELKEKTINLLDKYIDLSDILYKSHIK